MPPASPQPAPPAMPTPPRSGSTALRPALAKRTSSYGPGGQGQTPAPRPSSLRSPGSELDLQPLRHPVRAKGHARVVLPRNHSSGRNLAKLARQAETGGGGGGAGGGGDARVRLHGRQRSHEGDTEIRLPGSLDDSDPAPAPPPPMRRNMTSYQLPRNASHTKLKKNLSHGHLQRLGSGKDLAGMAHTKQKAAPQLPPSSPRVKSRSKRPVSAGWPAEEKDLHEQEVELARQRQERTEPPKRVGFAVGSLGDDDDAGQLPNMEGSGMDEGEWTEESASASPHSTRQNTANNSRRTSMLEKAAGQSTLSSVPNARKEPQTTQAEGDPEATETDSTQTDGHPERATSPANENLSSAQSARPATQPARSPLHAAKEHTNPTTQLLRRQSGHVAAPALVSNITALDNARSLRGSPAPSLAQSTSTLVNEHEQDELVSRFVPSTSSGSGANTTMQNTPKTGSFHTPENISALGGQHRDRAGFSVGPVSPGSTVSGSSGAATPAMGRSRIELKMLQEKTVADMESAAEKGPIIPAHVYDRRNESLKSYLQLAALAQGGSSVGGGAGGSGAGSSISAASGTLSLGPEIFQGRFKAINTELRVVQKFRDPMAESVARLQGCRGSKLGVRASPQKQAGALRVTKSAVSLPARGAPPRKDGGGGSGGGSGSGSGGGSSGLSTSASPPKDSGPPVVKAPLTGSKSSLRLEGALPGRRTGPRGVSFAGPLDAREARDADRAGKDDVSLDDIAAEMWNNVAG